MCFDRKQYCDCVVAIDVANNIPILSFSYCLLLDMYASHRDGRNSPWTKVMLQHFPFFKQNAFCSLCLGSTRTHECVRGFFRMVTRLKTVSSEAVSGRSRCLSLPPLSCSRAAHPVEAFLRCSSRIPPQQDGSLWREARKVSRSVLRRSG